MLDLCPVLVLPTSRDDYDRIREQISPFRRRLGEGLIERLGVRQGSRVLDIGCGSADEATWIAMIASAQVVGLDLKPGRHTCARISSVCGDAAALPIKTAQIDAAYSVNVIQLLSDRTRFFAEVRRVLKPGAMFAVQAARVCELQTRTINTYFPSLLAVELRRFPRMGHLRTEMHDACLSPIGRFTLHFAPQVLDSTYVQSLRCGRISGLEFIPSRERAEGLASLEAFVASRPPDAPSIMIRRTRSFLLARARRSGS